MPSATAATPNAEGDDETVAGFIERVMSPSDPVSSRRIVYNKLTGKFDQVEANPPSLTDEARRRHWLTESQKAFIKSKAPMDSRGSTLSPSKATCVKSDRDGLTLPSGMAHGPGPVAVSIHLHDKSLVGAAARLHVPMDKSDRTLDSQRT